MRFSSYINNQRCLEWGLNANQGALFDLLNQASSWAKEIVVNGVVYYWVSRNEIIKELPLFYSKPDTVYRHFVALNEKGLIEYRKHDGKDLIRLTAKGKTWNEFNSDLNPNNSEIDPNNEPQLGNKSEKTRIEIRKSSEIDPTNNNTNNKNTNNNKKINKKSSIEQSEFDLCFADFWQAGLVKVNRAKALKSFSTAFKSSGKSIREFTDMLVLDIRRRFSLGQFGFDKLHPTTYLNNRRWEDDYSQPENVKALPNPLNNKPDAHSGFAKKIYGETKTPEWAEEFVND
ncbi:hypothetical protein [Avibacterium paragallinarum]|uniref:hypothetical protein n=1 Tax=Avibacterium paragallinarum TaxID=728 RepID=UPI001A9225EB|nr:hypothetical protein [Avibacterium paragallinarum]